MNETIDIEVRSILTIRKVMNTGLVRMSIPRDGTVADLLEALVDRFGEKLGEQLFEPGTTNLWPYMHILVNGRHFAFTGRMGTALNDGDSVLIMPPAGGGA